VGGARALSAAPLGVQNAFSLCSLKRRCVLYLLVQHVPSIILFSHFSLSPPWKL